MQRVIHFEIYTDDPEAVQPFYEDVFGWKFEKFEGGPVGVSTIAAAVGEDVGTLEEVYEPFLVQNGFLQRTPRGRVATAQAYRHFGFNPPSTSAGAQQPTLF